MSAQDFDAIKRFVVKTLAKNIDIEMERLGERERMDKETYEQWGKEYMRIVRATCF